MRKAILIVFLFIAFPFVLSPVMSKFCDEGTHEGTQVVEGVAFQSVEVYRDLNEVCFEQSHTRFAVRNKNGLLSLENVSCEDPVESDDWFSDRASCDSRQPTVAEAALWRKYFGDPQQPNK